MSSNITKVIGTAGCGKTSYLIAQIERACEKYHPSRIGAVSFSKGATVELVDRICDKAGVSPASIQNVRTVHSMCFRLGKFQKKDIAEKNIKEFFEAYPGLAWNQVNSKYDEDLPEIDLTKKESNYNRNRFNMMNILRNRLTPEEEWPDDVQTFFEIWKDWMYQNEYIDFTGLLEHAFMLGLYPDIDVLFVDESQDSTPLQFSLLKKWSEKTHHTVFVGDPNQSIYGWAGSDPDAFKNLPAESTISLNQSHRVPQAVAEYASRIIHGLDMLPTEISGDVSKRLLPDFEKPGEHMLICRCNYQLNRWKKHLIKKGIPWHNPYRVKDKSFNPLETKGFRVLRAYEALSRDEAITAKELKEMVSCTIVKGNLKSGVKSSFKELSLKDTDKIERRDLQLIGVKDAFFTNDLKDVFKVDGVAFELASALRGKDSRSPVILGTIHSVKGGEADHVHLDMTTSKKCLLGILKSKDIEKEERRIAFVAVTRARQSLTLLQQKGSRNKVLP